VPNALRLLILLIAALPLFLVLDVSLSRLLLSIWVAGMLAIVGLPLRPREAAQAWRTVRGLLPAALLPLLWMGIQIIPTPFLAHPIWQSAASALGEPLSGKISADPALSVLALFRYIVAMGIVVATVGVAVDRRRAQNLLLALVVETGLITVAFVIIALGNFRLFGMFDVAGSKASFAAICSLGMLLAAALVAGSVNQFLVRHRVADLKGTKTLLELWIGSISLAACFATSAFLLAKYDFIAGMSGLALLVLATFLRHIPNHRWEARIAVGIFLVVAVVVIANQFAHGSGDFTLRAAAAPQVQTAIAQRMMSDAGPMGTGAGTYRALVQIYREINDPPDVFAAPTTAATIAVELGRPALVVIIALSAFLIIVLFRRALERGRDAAFAGAGAGCALTISLEMFHDTSLLNTSASILATVILGLAVGQSLSLPRVQ
jgi:hypothetical protein